MAKLVKFVYVGIVLVTLFLVATKVDCELFFQLFQISFYFFISRFSNINYFVLFLQYNRCSL